MYEALRYPTTKARIEAAKRAGRCLSPRQALQTFDQATQVVKKVGDLVKQLVGLDGPTFASIVKKAQPKHFDGVGKDFANKKLDPVEIKGLRNVYFGDNMIVAQVDMTMRPRDEADATPKPYTMDLGFDAETGHLIALAG